MRLLSFFANPGMIILLLFIFIVWLFAPAMSFEFVNWDDPEHLLDNPAVRTLNFENIRAIFSSTVVKTYIPLTTLSFMVEYHFFGERPFVFHLTNIILHALVTALIFCLARLMGAGILASAVAAVIFGAHPQHVESVAWVTERKDVLYALFYVLALLFYVRYTQRRRITYFAVSALLGFLSLLAKPMALSLPLILGLYDWWARRRWSWLLVMEKVLLIVVFFPVIWITFRAQARVPEMALGEGLLIWFYTFIFYIKKFFTPFFLTPIYPVPVPISILTPDYALSPVLFFSLLFVFWKNRNNRWLLFSGLFYVASIFFLLKNDTVVKCIVTDRFMYLPSLGICLCLGVWIERMWGRIGRPGRRIFAVGLFLILALLVVKNRQQQQIWRSSLALWEYVIRYNSDSAVAFNNRGALYGQRGDFSRALEDFNKAIHLRPDYREAYNNRAIVFSRVGRNDLALADYTTVMRLYPDYAETYYNRGVLFSRKKEWGRAKSDLSRALELNPQYDKAYNSRGVVYDALGEENLALDDFNRAVQLNPRWAEVYLNRGNIFVKRSQFLTAIKDFDRALDLDPAYSQAYWNKSIAFFGLDDYPQALALASKAKQLGYPVDPRYWNYLVSLVP
ncbi:MAG: tetratricopeptide repeat protein [Candidatus Omnitrophota bacterium]|jgi:tetratricopeptide (TPR) repeat protein